MILSPRFDSRRSTKVPFTAAIKSFRCPARNFIKFVYRIKSDGTKSIEWVQCSDKSLNFAIANTLLWAGASSILPIFTSRYIKSVGLFLKRSNRFPEIRFMVFLSFMYQMQHFVQSYLNLIVLVKCTLPFLL